MPAHRPPTIRDILTHTSGIGYGFENGDLVLGERNWLADHDLASMAQAFGDWPLRFQPGSHWLYSHGMDVAARLVEIMSGLPFDEYLRTAIFEPLGMVDTDFWVPADKVDRFAACYGRNARKELVLTDDPTTSTYLRKPRLLNGGGGLVGTTADYVRFCTMLAGGGALDGRRVLSRKTLELMTSNHLPGRRRHVRLRPADGLRRGRLRRQRLRPHRRRVQGPAGVRHRRLGRQRSCGAVRRRRRSGSTRPRSSPSCS